MSHPRSGLDRELTSPLRLSIAAALSRVEEAEFSAIRDAVDTNDAELSRQLSRLLEVGMRPFARSASLVIRSEAEA